MRQPSSLQDRWKWWEAAISSLPEPIHENEVHCGFFRVRKFPYGEWPTGPYVPARIWLDPCDVDEETGELLAPEQYRAEIDGRAANPWSVWTWLAANPVTEEEYQWLKAMSPLLPKSPPQRRR